MEYKGKLYGKVGEVVFPLLHSTDDWEAMEKKIAELEAQIKSQKSAIPIVSPRDHEFRTALILLRDLADIQNGAPLVTVEKEWEEIMKKTYDFLEANEG